MDFNKEEFSKLISKQATQLIIGGFRPNDSKSESWFGKILLQRKDEQWPKENGKDLFPLCQINLTTVPYKPEILNDIEFIAIFISGRDLPWDSLNGQGWLLRAYSKIEELIPIQNPIENPNIKSFQIRSELIEKDFPVHDDYPVEMPEEIEDTYYNIFPNISAFKIGGWPSLVQHEISWNAKSNKEVEFAFQIDSNSTGKANWGIADRGVAYFGREKNNLNQWYMSVQSL